MGASEHPDLRPAVRGVAFLLFFASATVVFLRFLSRYLSKTQFGLDDWLSLAAFPFCIPGHVTLIWNSYHGFGLYEYTPTPDGIEGLMKGFYWDEIFYFIVMMFAKLSVLAFYHKIFRSTGKGFKRVLWGTAIFIVLWGVPLTIASIFKCIPIKAAWSDVKGKCLQEKPYFLAQSFPNLVQDLILLFIPFPFLIRLHVRRSQKIALIFVFALGYFNPIISIIRIVETVKAVRVIEEASTRGNPFADPHVVYRFVPIGMWTTAEPSLAVISASIPTLQYLFTVVGAKITSTVRSTQNTSRKDLTGASTRLRNKLQSGNTSNGGTVTGKYTNLDGTVLGDKEPYEVTIVGSSYPRASIRDEEYADSQPLQQIRVKKETNVDYS